ncbi:uncharacterized protein LOC107045654 [Diachasma alloeum]|uniref:uncharacterized protein LOC107045654 n=1 Tax=Diachasma alloeum TaxID=454923 RepID=UPI000738481C|nr:uncharacterized protein LOC107045654 [Diachasma alloeum]
MFRKSARFRQGDTMHFPQERANGQCTAIDTFSIVALHFSYGNITRDFLDYILIEGDKYYVQSKSANNVTALHLCLDELLPSVIFRGHTVGIGIQAVWEGFFSSSMVFRDLTTGINSLMERHESSLHDSGFMYVAGTKTVVFISRLVGEKRNFFMFNSYRVDNNNCYPFANPNRGTARLFRCLTVEALTRLLLINQGGSGVWQIFCVQIYLEILLNPMGSRDISVES